MSATNTTPTKTPKMALRMVETKRSMTSAGHWVRRQANSWIRSARVTHIIVIMTKRNSTSTAWNAPPAMPTPPASTVRAAVPARPAAVLAS